MTDVATNPYQQAVMNYLASVGVDPSSPKGQAVQEQAAQGQAATGLGSQQMLNSALKMYMQKQAVQNGAGALSGSGSGAAASEAANAGYGGNAALAGENAAYGGNALGAEEGGQSLVGGAAPETSTLGAVAAPLALAGIAAYTGYTGYEAGQAGRHKGALGGLKAGIKAAGPLNAVPMLGQLAWGAGIVGGLTGGKTNKDQLARDALRSYLKDKGFIDDKYQVDLPTGNYDIGRDGHDPGYNVDFSKDGAAQAVGNANPLAAILSSGNGKLKDDLAGYLANAQLSSSPADMKKNALAMYAKANINQAQAFGAVQALGLDKATQEAYNNSINQVFGQEFHGTPIVPGSATMLAQAPSTVPLTPIPRSMTRSPGISKDGKRISY